MAGGQRVGMGLTTQGVVGGSDHEVLPLEWDCAVFQASNIVTRYLAEAFCRAMCRYHEYPSRFIASCSGKDRRENVIADIVT